MQTYQAMGTTDKSQCARLRQDLERRLWRLLKNGAKRKTALPYDIDGVVIKVNSFELAAGTGAGFPFAALGHCVQISGSAGSHEDRENFEIQVGRTGALDARRAPDTRSRWRASLCPAPRCTTRTRYAARTCASGIPWSLQRAGEVIPEIVEVVTAERTGDEAGILSCRRMPSPAIRPSFEAGRRSRDALPEPGLSRAVTGAAFEHFVSRGAMDIEGLGERIVAQLIANELVKDVSGGSTCACSWSRY